jgi:hypothetical protein
VKNNPLPDYQRHALELRREALLEEHAAASAQLSRELSEVNRKRLTRQIADLEQQIKVIDTKLRGETTPEPTPIPRKRVKGIPSELSKPLRETLLQCAELIDPADLRGVLSHELLTPWRDSVPTGGSSRTRVSSVLSHLADQYRTDGQNALVIFLQVLADNYPEDNRLHGQLLQLAERLQAYK